MVQLLECAVVADIKNQNEEIRIDFMNRIACNLLK